jgi:predicted nucleotidyltransferase
MDKEIRTIAKKLRSRIEEKYIIRDARVFGSSAWGERRSGSDIDIFICLEYLNRIIEEDLFDIAYDIELEDDCLIDLIAVSDSDIKGKIGTTPIYKQIMKEGIVI